MSSKIEKLRKLTFYEWHVLLAAMLWLPIVALLLQVMRYKRTRKILEYFISDKIINEEPSISEVKNAQTIIRMVNIAARYGPYRANCLRRSIMLWWILGREGIASEIRFGIKKEYDNDLDAHAWVEVNKINVCDPFCIQEEYLAFHDS